MDIVYEVLKKIPGVTDNEARRVIDKISFKDEVATKVDKNEATTKADLETGLAKLKAELIAEMYRINNRTNMWVLGVGIAVIIALFLK